ncbi:MAG TPA: PIN domain-containing protein [Terriglobales bacterium]|nr:PIN domain-containing protein [Terriglobales bacterium]
MVACGRASTGGRHERHCRSSPHSARGASKLPRLSGVRRADLEQRILAVVVLPFDLDLCRVYARTRASLPAGVTVAANDLWIAACALRHALPLISNNHRHFQPVPGLQLIPPPLLGTS